MEVDWWRSIEIDRDRERRTRQRKWQTTKRSIKKAALANTYHEGWAVKCKKPTCLRPSSKHTHIAHTDAPEAPERVNMCERKMNRWRYINKNSNIDRSVKVPASRARRKDSTHEPYRHHSLPAVLQLVPRSFQYVEGDQHPFQPMLDIEVSLSSLLLSLSLL